MTSLKEAMNEACDEHFLPGNSCCAGCGLELALRWAMKALGDNTALVAPASCLNVVVGLWPKTAPDFPFVNMAFAAGAAAATGFDAAFKAKAHRFPQGPWKDMTAMTFAGDGGTTDIGIQGLSGAAERNTDMIYVCYDNEAYMNTGIQRSSSTPHGAKTTTTPFGKQQYKKDLPRIMEAHDIPYVATCSISEPLDLYDKFKKAKEIKGCRYIHILAPCPPGWGYSSENSIEIARLAIKTGSWILYEVENGVKTISKPSKRYMDPEKRIPLTDYISKQKRFSSVSEKTLIELQNQVDKNWKKLASELKCQEEYL
ncbi:MAG: pyruvate synthase subunit beta [Candidatus Lokiarchaeota archaeon]|nr:pyruvate synthase subunit beta [Candidatus Lokiarchaeota archaeon]MBD3199344.1 pyruvate synthase subunit beta [Candidatus Lokiarchaeota archaeon]